MRFFSNQNWPHRNEVFCLDENKWPPFFIDFDATFNFSTNENLFIKLYNSKSVSGQIFKIINDNQKLNQLFISRMNKILNEILQPDNINSIIDENKSHIESEIEFHLKRWNMIADKSQWNNNIKNLNVFCEKRRNLMV